MPSESMNYFLIIDGVDGGSLNQRFVRSFDLTGFEFDIEALRNGADFSPLSAAVGAGRAADELMALLIDGTKFNVRLVGVTPGQDPRVAYDLRLAGAQITSYGEQSGQSNLTFSFEQVTLTNYHQLNTGQLIPETAGWNLITDQALTTALTPAATAGSDSGQASPAPADIIWYLRLADIDGGVTRIGGLGAFELTGFDFQMMLKAGKAAFDPITVLTNFGSAADEIFKLIASGAELDPDGGATAAGARIIGVRRSDMNPTPFYDLRLGEVTLASASRALGTGETIDTLTLDFTRFSLTTGGGAVALETVSFDRKTGEKGSTQLTAPAVVDEDTAAVGNLKYYLYLDGIDGGDTTEGHVGAFQIDSFNFAANHRGRDVAFNPVTIDFHVSSDVTKLMQLIESGKSLGLARIVGERTVMGDNIEQLDLRFSGASIRSLLQAGLAPDQLTLGFKAYTLTTTNSSSVSETTGWDIARDKPLSNPLAPAVPLQTEGGAPGDEDNFYLLIDGIDGGSKLEQFLGALEIESYSLDMKAGGKGTFGTIDIEFGNDVALSGLLEYAATAKKIGNVQLVGFTDSGEELQKIYYDLRLGGARIASVLEEDNLGHDHISLTFGKYSVTTTDADGDKRNFGYDIAAGKEIRNALAEAEPGEVSGLGGGRDYFMTIDGIDGGSRAEKHLHAFEIEDFSFAFSRRGKPQIEVSFNTGSTADEFMQMIARGRVVDALQIVGDVNGERVGSNPYDLRFADVRLTSISDRARHNDTLIFTYEKFSLSTKVQSQDSTFGEARTTGFDFDKGAAIKKALDAATPGADNGGGAAQTSDNVTTYLLLDGMDGGERVDHLAGGFELSDMTFDVTRAGRKLQFEPLAVTLLAGAAADELFALIAGGLDLGKARIVSVKEGAQPLTVLDMRLADVELEFLDSIYDKNSETGHEVIELSFGALSITTASQLDTGGSVEETYSYDLATGVEGINKLPAAVPVLV